MKTNAHRIDRTDNLVDIIEVEDRFRVQYELFELFHNRAVKRDRQEFCLKKSHIEAFKNYSNFYSEIESPFYHKKVKRK